MNNLNAYSQQISFGGWTRIEMLISIYDKAIESFSMAQSEKSAGNESGYAQHMLAGQKAVLAIHAGLKPDSDEVAFNIARLLHFVLTCIEDQNLEDAVKVLSNMKAGFLAIHDEANQLESAGAISPVPDSDAFEASA